MKSIIASNHLKVTPKEFERKSMLQIGGISILKGTYTSSYRLVPYQKELTINTDTSYCSNT